MSTRKKNSTEPVVIVGGGPVGLFLGICLHQAGIPCKVLEQRTASVTHSRSIGIHPVSLELFEAFGIADFFIEEGIKVKKGHAFWNSQKIGTLSFDSCPPPYRFILTLPQNKTEQLLASCLNRLDPTILQRNTEVTAVQQTSNKIQLTVLKDGKQQTITAQYVAGCDGMNSFVRQAADIAFKGKTYNDTYIMGDFSDNTDFGNDAAIFLCDAGLIESFPLPGNRRRWVVKTDRYLPEVNRAELTPCINRRINFQLNEAENYMLSSFKVFNKRVETMRKGRILLAGDAAHVVSPIGGQGMNLGWLDAYDLSQCLQKIFFDDASLNSVLQTYSARRLSIAKKAARRAAFNMALGRKTPFPFFKKWILQTIVNTPLSKRMANLFTMRGFQ